MINNIIKDADSQMQYCLNRFKDYIAKIRCGKIYPELLDNIKIEYYGNLVSLFKLSNITAEDNNTLSIVIFDSNLISKVEKAIINSDLQLNPSIINNTTIKIFLPPLTEERRQQLIKVIRLELEKEKICIRNIRRDFNNKIKKLLKEKMICKNENYVLQNNIQKLTDEWIKKINSIFTEKEKELLNNIS